MHPKKVNFVDTSKWQNYLWYIHVCAKIALRIKISGKWDFSEQADLLMVFKSMLLGGLKKDNYKELAKRLNEIGWNRTNDQCWHEVNNCNKLLFLRVKTHKNDYMHFT